MTPDAIPAFDLAFFDREKPWLVLGKGPSFSGYRPDLGQGFNTVALNHAMRGLQIQLGHTLDIEVIEQMDTPSLSGVEFLCIPWRPHVRHPIPLTGGKVFFGPGKLTLADYCQQIPVLKDFMLRGRLLTYNFCTATASEQRADLPMVEGYTFSAAVVTRLLAQAGVTLIRTLGVDGGTHYSDTFQDLAELTKLQTPQSSFNAQFAEIAATIQRFSVDFGPLDHQVPARVFVGCMPEQELAFQVLHFSIQRHSSMSVSVHRLHDCIANAAILMPLPRDKANQPRTPFSFQRFAIPELCGFQGKALYLDSDMLVLRDLRELWQTPMNGMQMLSAQPPRETGRQAQFSVMLMDCEKLPWRTMELVSKLDDGQFTYGQLMHQMASVERWQPSLPATWNSLEHHVEGETCLVHFTDMDRQPWLNPLHPHAALWSSYLLAAIREGHISHDTLLSEVRSGHVRPSLLDQVRLGIEDPRNLPFEVLRRDWTHFLAPHRKSSAALGRIKHEMYRSRSLLVYASTKLLIHPIRSAVRNTAKLMLRWVR